MVPASKCQWPPKQVKYTLLITKPGMETQEWPEECKKELKASAWPPYTPHPNLINQLWDAPDQVQSIDPHLSTHRTQRTTYPEVLCPYFYRPEPSLSHGVAFMGLAYSGTIPN